MAERYNVSDVPGFDEDAEMLGVEDPSDVAPQAAGAGEAAGAAAWTPPEQHASHQYVLIEREQPSGPPGQVVQHPRSWVVEVSHPLLRHAVVTERGELFFSGDKVFCDDPELLRTPRLTPRM